METPGGAGIRAVVRHAGGGSAARIRCHPRVAGLRLRRIGSDRGGSRVPPPFQERRTERRAGRLGARGTGLPAGNETPLIRNSRGALRELGMSAHSVSGTEGWRGAHPGAVIGLLELSGVENTRPSPALDVRKRETEAQLRERCKGFSRPDFRALPVMSAYEQYYKRFNKTYHVQLQVESIVLKGKSLPKVSPLVDANFVAEVETLVLTAGHDVAKLEGDI